MHQSIIPWAVSPGTEKRSGGNPSDSAGDGTAGQEGNGKDTESGLSVQPGRGMRRKGGAGAAGRGDREGVRY